VTTSHQLVQRQRSPHSLHKRPTKKQWEQLITPEQREPIEAGAKSGRPLFSSMDEVVESAKTLDFHPLDPFVASVASGIDARRTDEPGESENVYLSVKEFYDEPLVLEAGLKNGPDAPMMVILPGVYGDLNGGHGTVFKKIAYERGMNYTVIANPLSEQMVGEEPKHHPGNIELEAKATHAIMKELKERKPEFFDQVTVAGYSYGALLAANVAKVDEAKASQEERVIQGGVVALSPPEDLYHSMTQLDGLRERYENAGGAVTATALLYMTEVGALGYDRFMESNLALRDEETNSTEVEIADSYGSRDNMKDMVAQVDDEFKHFHLPPPFPGYFERRRILNNMTYEQYSDEWFTEDPWLIEQGITPQELGARNSYSKALDKIEKTPVLTLLSADDYILKAEDVETFRNVDTNTEDLEYTHIIPTGGHVGLLFNPAVRDFLGDFAVSAELLKKAPEGDTEQGVPQS